MRRGGAELHLYSICEHLQDKFDITLYVFDKRGPLYESYRNINVNIRFVNVNVNSKVKYFYIFNHLIYLQWVNRFDIIHYFLPTAYIIGGIASIFSPKSIRIMSRRSLNKYSENTYLLRPIEILLHRKMNYITANSNAIKDNLMSEKVSINKIKIIYNGVRDNSFFEINRYKKNYYKKSDFTIIVLANLIAYKGHLDVIKALERINKSLPDKWRCLMIGRNDGIKDILEKEAVKCGLGRNIEFIENVINIKPFLQCADISLLCSHEEGFSNAIIESMSAGLPVIATDVGGNVEAVQNNYNGFIVRKSDVKEIGNKILLLLDPCRRRLMGENSKKIANEKYRIDKCIAAYEDMYKICLTGPCMNTNNGNY